MEDKKTSKFLIIYQDINTEDTFTQEQIIDATKAHVEHCRELDFKGILFLCGPLLGKEEKGMFILNAQSYKEAEEYVLRDPLIARKGYNTYLIYEIQEANAENNYLLEFYTNMEMQ
ncbi:MAG: hypothetical protein LBV71_01090 [Prevotella sp.]|jgi:uncharacterized protein YciI|nr:hypothetical protein [Prevotella sp.]